MTRHARFGLGLLAALLLGVDAAAAEEYEVRWSATLMADIHVIMGTDANGNSGGFFDQYEFVPNKGTDVPAELGLRDAELDVFGDADTPRLQFRLESPTSNLGVSEPDIRRPFLNQRADLFGRLDGLALDIDYRRMRTEELRVFPGNANSPLTFSDTTMQNDRFFHERTGFGGEIRTRPHEALGDPSEALSWLAPELALRGGYQDRQGRSQTRFLIPPTNIWRSLTRTQDQAVSDIGGGLLVAPGGLFTMTFDVDHEEFRENAPTLYDTTLGISPNATRTIGFVPDTDRTTGSVKLHRRFGERALLQAGFQASQLKQVDERTAAQLAAGMNENQIRHYSANVTADVSIIESVSANAFFKYDDRDNQIQRNTTLFNQGNGTQVDPFLKDWTRMLAGAEVVYRPFLASQFALGFKGEWVDRNLEFALPGLSNRRILSENALIAEKTTMYTVYGRTNLRPARGMSLWGEVGYRNAPRTGYITELDDYFYGKLRASYTLPLARPVVLSVLAQGGTGKNRDFDAVFGRGPIPLGPQLNRDFDRSNYLWGVTASGSPWDPVTLFASFYQGRDAQDYSLVLSNLQRFFQDVVPLTFNANGDLEYGANDLNVVAGTHVDITDQTDAALSYTFTRAKTQYRANPATVNTRLIQNNALIDSDIHRLDFEVGHWVMEGLRVLVGYRLQIYDDRAPIPASIGTRVAPMDLSATRHTITLGVTLNSDLLD